MNNDWKVHALRYVSLGASLLMAQRNNDTQKIAEIEREMSDIKSGLGMSHEAIINEASSMVMKTE